jgi:hypothetical protein
MITVKKLQIVGTSKCLIISKELRDLLGIENTVKITIKNNKMIIEKE